MKVAVFLNALIIGIAAIAITGRDSAATASQNTHPTEEPLQQVLSASSVTTFQSEYVGLNWFGSFVAVEDRNIPGKNAVYTNNKRSKMHFLGCSFDMEPRDRDPVLRSASQALSKVTHGASTSAHGYLSTPQRGGILDPTIDLACDESRAYYYFTFRNRVGFSNNFDHSTLVLEYRKGEPNPFDSPYTWMEPNLSKSKQAALITENMENMYVIRYIEPENKARAERERKEIGDFVVKALPLALRFLTGS